MKSSATNYWVVPILDLGYIEYPQGYARVGAIFEKVGKSGRQMVDNKWLTNYNCACKNLYQISSPNVFAAYHFTDGTMNHPFFGEYKLSDTGVKLELGI